ncbi:hypothetical protein [Gimesia maris]|uniref:hypothetical protein n=1 Tax=Gimesia maris TaxID=122 RepID=UPI0032EF7ECF
MKFNQKEWALVLALVTGGTVWFVRVERLLTTMVEQGKYSTKHQDWAVNSINTLDKRVDAHDIELSIIKGSNKPAQGFNAQ